MCSFFSDAVREAATTSAGLQPSTSDKPGATKDKKKSSMKKRDKPVSFQHRRATNSTIPNRQQQVSGGSGVRLTLAHTHKTILIAPKHWMIKVR